MCLVCVCVCELNTCASKCECECACIHLRMIDWKGESYQAIPCAWFQSLSDFLIISRCQCHHQVEKQWSLGWTGAKAINSWLQGAGGKSRGSHHKAHHQAARIQPSGILHMMWGSSTCTRAVSPSVKAPRSCTALGLYMILYIISFKTFTAAIEVKHEGWKAKTTAKPPAG